MCGIVGFVSNNTSFNQDTIKQMLNTIQHRGPDMSDFIINSVNNNQMALGHARLSIIDVNTENGKQPMKSADGRYVIIFNGEIYNYKELKQLAISKGYTEFRSTTDTEVILAMYSIFKEECVNYFNGMFAFVIYDNVEDSLFITRDRLGKKPLYYFNDHETFAFSSEIKALLQLPTYTRELDYNSLCDFLRFRYVRNPKTMFKNIFKLEPAHYLTIKNNEVSVTKYWDIVDFSDKDIDQADVEKLLLDSVNLRMRADVPVGAFLSGGLDSSLIVAMMCKYTDKKIQTFSVGFKEEEFSELNHAKVVASALGTDHTQLVISGKDIIENLEECIYYRDEPVSETSEVAIYLLSREARKKVKVILSGEGSDECFAGYPKYSYDYLAESKLINSIFKAGSFFIEKLPSKYRKVYSASKALSMSDYLERYEYWFCSFDNSEVNRVLNPSILKDINNKSINIDLKKIDNNLKRMQYYDIKYWLTDNLLDRADKMLMAHSLEGRMPFLDFRLVEQSFNLPELKKIHGREGKKIIKNIAEKYIPKSIIDRKKSGFYIPLAEWFRGELKDYVYDTLLGEKFRQRNLFKMDEIELIINQHMEGKKDNYKKIWMLISLELWFRVYFDN